MKFLQWKKNSRFFDFQKAPEDECQLCNFSVALSINLEKKKSKNNCKIAEKEMTVQLFTFTCAYLARTHTRAQCIGDEVIRKWE